MAQQCGQPQQRPTNRPLTRSRTRHVDHRNGEAHRSPTSWSTEGCQEHDAGRKVQVLGKPSHENQTGKSHQESEKRSSFVHESKKLSRQFHDRLSQSTLPFSPPDTSEPWVTDITDIKVHTTVPSLSDGDTQDDTVKQSLTLAMIAERYPQEAWIHVFTDGSETNAVTNGGALPRRTESLSKHGRTKALLQFPCRNRCPHTGCLHSAGFRSWLQTSCIPLWRPLRPAGIPKPQAPKPDQSPTASYSYQEGCSAVDSSPLWNIRKWASGHPGKGGCQRRTACQQCQLQWKEDSHQSPHNDKITEGWLPSAVPEAASHSGEASHRA